MSESDAPNAQYRDWLVRADRDISADFDKAVLALAGGALGVSIGFLRPGATPRWGLALGLAWGLLVLSLLSTFLSLITSQKALRNAIAAVDKGRIHWSKAGGGCATATAYLNYFAALAVVLGILLLSLFAWVNLERLAR